MNIFIYFIFLIEFIISEVLTLTPAELNFELAKADVNHKSRGRSYRHRSRRSEEVEELKKTFGVSSENKRRRAPVKNLISEEEIQSFFEDWLPRRSTVPPSTSIARRQFPVRVTPVPTRSAKKRQQRKTNKHKDQGKKLLSRITIKPRRNFAREYDPAVKALILLLKNEAKQMRKKILKRKINETKEEIKKLEAIKQNKPRKKLESESMEFADWLGKSIEDQEVEMLKRRQVKIGTLKPVSPSFNRIRSSGQTFFQKKKSNGYSRNDQTKVISSPVIIEQTPAPSTIPFHVRDGETRKWRKPMPIRAPTVRRPMSGVTTRTVAFGALTVDGEFKRQMNTLSPTIVNDVIERRDKLPPYPFSHCYVNKDGLMCCNRFLESLMRKSYDKARRTARSTAGDLQQMAQRVQADCEHVFNTTFETIVSYEDYALRAHFAGDLMCKIQQDGEYITVYATSMPHRNGSRSDPLSIITPVALNAVNSREDLIITSNLRGKLSNRIPYHELSREDVENERAFSNDISN